MKKLLIGIVILLISILIIFAILNNETDITITFNNTEVTTKGDVLIKDNTVYIEKGGKYILKGKAVGYKIEVNTKDAVELILDNVSLENDKEIFDIKKSENVILTINGENQIISKEKQGISSKATINIIGEGTFNIEANEGIIVDNNVSIKNAKLNINTIGDAIKTKNLKLNKAKINIKTNTDYILDDTNGRFTFKNNRYIKVAKTDLEQYDELYSLANSSKGLNVNGELMSSDTILEIDSIDDAINVSEKAVINKTTGTIYTNDDALTSEISTHIDNSDLNIKTCYEGIESENIIIENSNFKISGDDDALNVVGDENIASLMVKNSNIIVNVDGDGFDVSGRTDIINSNVYMSTGGDGLQSVSLYIDASKVEVNVYDSENFAFISTLDLLNGEVILAQKNSQFFLNSDYKDILEGIKTPYTYINGVNKFEIVDEENNEILNIDNDYIHYIYINNEIEKDKTYYLVTEDSKEVLEFNNVVE